VRPHDLRHAHASWLLAGGADLQTVKERLGHGTITTTEQYLHTLNGADDTALTALSSIRCTLSTSSGSVRIYDASERESTKGPSVNPVVPRDRAHSAASPRRCGVRQ
jgi:hypothetical protein